MSKGQAPKTIGEIIKYWRYVSKHKDHGRGSGNIGMSGGMSLGSLIRREAMDLR